MKIKEYKLEGIFEETEGYWRLPTIIDEIVFPITKNQIKRLLFKSPSREIILRIENIDKPDKVFITWEPNLGQVNMDNITIKKIPNQFIEDFLSFDKVPNLTAKLVKERNTNELKIFLMFTKALNYIGNDGVGNPPPASGVKI